LPPIVRGPPFVGTPMPPPELPPAEVPGLGLSPFLLGLSFLQPSSTAPPYLDESALNPARASGYNAPFGPPEIDRFGGLRNPFDIIADLYHALTDNLKPTPQPAHEYGYATGIGTDLEGLTYFAPSVIPRIEPLQEVVVTAPRPKPAPGLVTIGDPFAPVHIEQPGDAITKPGVGSVKPETPTKPKPPSRALPTKPVTPFKFYPFDPFKPEPLPQPEPQGQPPGPDVMAPEKGAPANKNDCGCTPSDNKKKKEDKKKHEPRAVCYQGTYIERANGLLKYRRKQIPCR